MTGAAGAGVPSGTIISLVNGTPAPTGYTMIGAFSEEIRTGDDDRDDRSVNLRFNVFCKN